VSRQAVHDMRRSAVRSSALACRDRSQCRVGHKTESIHRRYAIVDEAMQREAAAPSRCLGEVTAAPTVWRGRSHAAGEGVDELNCNPKKKRPAARAGGRFSFDAPLGCGSARPCRFALPLAELARHDGAFRCRLSRPSIDTSFRSRRGRPSRGLPGSCTGERTRWR
jgi:hypothetical protein